MPAKGPPDARVSVANGALTLGKTVELARVACVFAMPLASTRPQSAGHGESWWVCASLKPAMERVVLLRGLRRDEAVALAAAGQLDLA